MDSQRGAELGSGWLPSLGLVLWAPLLAVLCAPRLFGQLTPPPPDTPTLVCDRAAHWQ